jgi:hypothetical protein
MSTSFLARRAPLLLRPAVSRRTFTTTTRRLATAADTTAEQKAALSEDSKRNPEVYVRFFITQPRLQYSSHTHPLAHKH